MVTFSPLDAWLQPQWPAPPWVRALMTTRAGGISHAPFDYMNLGDHVGDDPFAVAHNRQLLQQAANMRAVFLQQVHGQNMALLDAASPDVQPAIVADACISNTPRVACTIMVADCLPVLIAHRDARIVGAAHAGWRGLAGEQGQGVLENLMAGLRQQLQAIKSEADSNGWIAWLGPCIGPHAFEVGDEVRQAFMTHNAAAQQHFVPNPQTPNKWLADLAGLARQRLAALGVDAVYGNNSTTGWCTYSQPEKFYSYRRDQRTGRMGAAVWLAA